MPCVTGHYGVLMTGHMVQMMNVDDIKVACETKPPFTVGPNGPKLPS